MTAHWICPRCDRPFGRPNQSHACVPVRTLAEYYEARPVYEHDLYEAVLTHLRDLGPVVVEPADVGLLVKGRRTFVEMRPRPARVELSVILPHAVTHPRVRRAMGVGASGNVALFIDLRVVSDVDDDVRAWLTESFATFAAGS